MEVGYVGGMGISRHNLLRRTLVGVLRLDQFFLRIALIGNEFSLTNMTLLTIGRPDLVAKPTSLAFDVLVRTAGIEARVELARCWEMCEVAVGSCAISTVATQRHGRMLEGAVWVRAVGEELAQCLGLVCCLNCRGRMASSTIAVFARCSKCAMIGGVDWGAFWGGGILVRIRAILPGAS